MHGQNRPKVCVGAVRHDVPGAPMLLPAKCYREGAPGSRGEAQRGADDLAWQYGLRGYDAMHLAAALLWQDGLEESVTLATFDRQLWQAGRQSGLAVFPADLA